MKYLPMENITYKTKLKKEEIKERLSDNIDPEKGFSFNIFGNQSTKPYEGQFNGKAFYIKRIVRNRNSFLPRISGTIKENTDGAMIQVKMQLHSFVIVFLSIWCGVVGLVFIVFLMQAFDDSGFNPAVLIPFAMLLIVYGAAMLGFKLESKKSKKELQSIFEAEIIKE